MTYTILLDLDAPKVPYPAPVLPLYYAVLLSEKHIMVCMLFLPFENMFVLPMFPVQKLVDHNFGSKITILTIAKYERRLESRLCQVKNT